MKIKKIAKGLTVCSGYVTGKACVIKNKKDYDKFSTGEILVIPNSSPNYAMLVMSASALVCEKGGMLSHICIVAMEMGIPCVTQVEDITSLIKTGQLIHLDATNGEILLNE